MKSKQWESILSVFEQMSSLSALAATDDSRGDAQEPTAGAADNTAAFLDIRKRIRNQLDFLRVQLLEELTERDVYFVLFPIVALFDERVQTQYLKDSQTNWPPLQKELFRIDDAGDMFYESLDEILIKPQTLPFVYEVYYFCLKYGFKGRYNDNALKINAYMKKLRAKIAAAAPEKPVAQAQKPDRFRRMEVKTWYYVAAVVLMGIFYGLFYGIAHLPNDGAASHLDAAAVSDTAQPFEYHPIPEPPALVKGD